MARRIGIVPSAFARPLFSGLRKHGTGTGSDPVFEVVEDNSAQLAHKLREGELDGAFLSPSAYATSHTNIQIVPGSAISSEGESGAIMLTFNEHALTLKTIAVDPVFPSEILLTDLIMKEKYDIIPKFVLKKGTIEETLGNADAVLCVDPSAEEAEHHSSKIDIVDEWYDITELPYVHGFWAVRDDRLTRDQVRKLQQLSKISDDEHDTRFRYDFDEDIVMALTEFYRMAYYYGNLKDIPDVKFYQAEETKGSE